MADVPHTAEKDAPVRVGFRYQDGEVLNPEREALSRSDELPEVVLDLGDGEWLTLAEVRIAKPACEACGVELSEDGACWWCDDGPTPTTPLPPGSDQGAES